MAVCFVGPVFVFLDSFPFFSLFNLFAAWFILPIYLLSLFFSVALGRFFVCFLVCLYSYLLACFYFLFLSLVG